jgi:hypothetical protein
MCFVMRGKHSNNLTTLVEIHDKQQFSNHLSQDREVDYCRNQLQHKSNINNGLADAAF